MIWLTWRQHRAQVLVTMAFLLVLGGLMLAAGTEKVVLEILGWLPLAPLLIGLFWGAPLLAREFERGTHRLVWTQSVPRRRWLVVKLGGLGFAVTLAGLALGFMVTAWLTGVDGMDRGNPGIFGATGVAAGAWWLFAFMLGTAASAMLKRLLPAMAVTVAVFLVAGFGIFISRDEYATPVRVVGEVPAGAVGGGADGAYLAPDGTEVSVPPQCADAGRDIFMDCVQESGYRRVSYFHPPDRYWRFQWTEAGILLLATGLLAAAAAYRVARRPV